MVVAVAVVDVAGGVGVAGGEAEGQFAVARAQGEEGFTEGAVVKGGEEGFGVGVMVGSDVSVAVIPGECG